MASITIRQLGDRTKQRLRVRAALHGRSMEEEAREILRCALAEELDGTDSLADIVRRCMAPAGGVELELPPRESIREPPDFR